MLSVALIASVWQVLSLSMLIMTPCDLRGPTGGGAGVPMGDPKGYSTNTPYYL